MKQLLPKVPQYFKANLHTHSNISDGKLTREEVKEGYKALTFDFSGCIISANPIPEANAI